MTSSHPRQSALKGAFLLPVARKYTKGAAMGNKQSGNRAKRTEQQNKENSERLKEFYRTAKGRELKDKLTKANGCRVVTPHGVFDSYGEAGKFLGIPPTTIGILVKSPWFPDWQKADGLVTKTVPLPKVETGYTRTNDGVEIIERKLQPR